jgi:hypothetical protein
VQPRAAVQPATFRAVLGVGPGTRPPARLSPIVALGARPVSTGPAPAQAPRPLHPPIARVPAARLGTAALQATAAAERFGPGAAAARAASHDPGSGRGATGIAGASRIGFGMPSLRRNVCPHFYMTGARGAIPIQAPHLLKALVRQEANVSRCQLRGGVHLEQGYVNDVCLSARFNQCVFYEDDLTR